MKITMSLSPNSSHTNVTSIGPADVIRAHKIIAAEVPPTPLKYSEYFSKKYKIPIYFKLENLNISGSFKIRGAAHALLTQPLAPLQKSGVMSISAGNHAQGLAYMANQLGVKATIFMPKGTSLIKITSTQSYGAEVRLEGDHYMDTEKKGLEWASQSGARPIHAFDQIEVVLGQGTVGYEIHQDLKDVGVVIAPVGGGGLLSGIAAYMRGLDHHVTLMGVQSHLCCPVSQHLGCDTNCPLKEECGKHNSQTIKAHATLADGIAIKTPSQMNLHYLKTWVDQVFCVTEKHLAGAIMNLLEREHILAEGAGAASVAALEIHRDQIIEQAKGRAVVCVISGGNIDASLLARIMQKGLVQSHRMIRITLHLEDHPGALAHCLKVVAETGANIYHLDHNRIFNHQGVKAVEVIFDLEISHKQHCQEVLDHLNTHGYDVVHLHESPSV